MTASILRTGVYESAIYSLSLPRGTANMISPILAGPNGLAWSADDKKLVYSGWKGNYTFELGEVWVENGSPRRLALDGIRPAVSRKGDKLAYGSLSVPAKLWRRDLLDPELPPVEFIPSSRPQYDAQYSPDGKRIVFVSLRSGLQGVWISNGDGSNLVQISDAGHVSGSPQSSPDGNKIVFDSFAGDHWKIYVADVTERKPRKLVTNVTSMVRPSLVPRWKVDLFSLSRRWQRKRLSLPRFRR